MASDLTFIASPGPCIYLPDRIAQLCYQLEPDLTPATYMARLHEGWRRFGAITFRPQCPSCRACHSLRIPVPHFRASESQRRAWKRSVEHVEIRIGSPAQSPEKLDLFERFHHFGHETKGWELEDEAPDLGFLTDNPFATEEWSFYLGGTLVGVGYVDVLPEGLSAIYFYWDPMERQRSLGTFNILAIIEAARRRRLPYVFLGYYVEGCRSLQYKGRFRPNEILRDGRWQPFVG